MRHLFSSFISALFILASGPAFAQLIETDADYAVILDHDSGEILYSKNGDDLMIPASMTKIMTAHIVFERLKTGEIQLDDQFTVSERAWREGGWATGGSTMGLGIGETPTVAELLRGVIVLSGNDACIVLAEGLSGSEEAFASEMTDLARNLGLSSATFKNASGLDAEGHRISAADLARLASLTISEFPQYYELYAEETYEWGGIRQPNRNPLLGSLDGADGLKTGRLSVSGYGLVGSAKRGNDRRIIVVNGLGSEQARAQEAERLMRFAFSAFETRTVQRAGQRLADLDVWMGSARTVGVTLKDDIPVTAHKRVFARGKSEIVYDSPLMAPIAEGDHIADLVITLEDKAPITVPLHATETIERLDFFGKAIEGLSYMISPSG